MFRRTILDIPLLIFLGSQLISTILSLDPQTSFLGYYSRFNGGLLSTICYSLLYWAFVSNFDAKETAKLIKIWLASGVVVSIYGVLEHFGIDKNVWVQDVQWRVFSTLGQPNWLAAWIVALLPVTWAGIIETKFETKNLRLWTYLSISVLFTWTLIFTKSRSGLLGFAVAIFIFGGLTIWKKFKKVERLAAPVSVIGLSFLMIGLISGTQYTPSLYSLVNHSTIQPIDQAQGPALETGGTESGVIRAIVWKGAVQIWQHYPIFGTGVETFAYSYPMFRPAEHNLVSEWDFIYNKAHNEYLNLAANTGSFGLLSYLFLIGSSIYMIVKISNKYQYPINTNPQSEALGIWNLKLVLIGIISGYSSLLVTNFFGFSVVPTQLELFLFPAIAVALANSEQVIANSKRVTIEASQKIVIILTLLAITYMLFAICKYWYADTLYTNAKAYNGAEKSEIAISYLKNAISLEPDQPLYHTEIANSYTNLAIIAYQERNATDSSQLTALALSESQKALDLSPNNPNVKRSRFSIFITLTSVSPKYLLSARDTLINAIESSPTDAKLYYNLGLTYARTGEMDKALATLKKTIELKSNYKEARLAYAILLINKKQNTEARVQLEYILKNIDPTDSLTRQTFESIK